MGTAAERTRLSWTRTTLAIVAGGVTMARLSWTRAPALGAIVLVVVCATATLVVLATLRDRSFAGTADAPGPGRDGVLLAVVAGGTCAVGCAAVALVALT